MEHMEWPDKKNELWRRTPSKLLLKELPGTEPGSEELLAPAELPAIEDSGRLRIAGGRVSYRPGAKAGGPDFLEPCEALGLYPEEQDFFHPGAWEDKFQAWADSASTATVFLDFKEDGVQENPFVISIDSLRTEGYATPRIFLRFGRNWKGTVLLFYSGDADGLDGELTNALLRIRAERNSSVRLAELQNLGPGSRLNRHLEARIDTDALFEHGQFQCGGGVVKTDSRFALDGIGAELHADALLVSGAGAHKDVRIEQKHGAPQTLSRSTVKAAANNGGRTVFQGMIRVEEDAPGSDAYMSNKNLILKNGSRADANPGLKILTDDVKCSHGSTTGKVDPQQLFYLMSRGCSRQEAIRLITEGLFQELANRFPELPGDWLAGLIDRSLETGE